MTRNKTKKDMTSGKSKKPAKNTKKSKSILSRTRLLETAELIPKPLTSKQLEKFIPKKKGNGNKKFTDSMIKKIIEIMVQGKSKAFMCREIGITVVTAFNWSNPDSKYYEPRFVEAVGIEEELSKAWWEETGRLNVHNKEFNSTLFMMNMSNRFGWSRKLEGKMTDETITRTINENKLTVEVLSNDETIAEIGDILARVGAIKPPTKEIIDSEVN